MTNTYQGLLKPIIIGVIISIISAYIILLLDINKNSESNIPSEASKQSTPLSASSRGINVSGSYRGTAYNYTYDSRGNIRLIINQDTSGKITGTVNVTGNLSGSGSIEGFTDGYNIGISFIGISEGMIITFQGIFEDGVISGDYTVSVSSEQQALGLVDQEGNLNVYR